MASRDFTDLERRWRAPLRVAVVHIEALIADRILAPSRT